MRPGHSPELDLLGITTVTGNVPVAATTRNVLDLLHALGRDDVPVAAGAERGLVRAHGLHPPIHGSNGIDGVDLPAAPAGARPEHAVAFLAGLLRKAAPRSVTIVAIGPLTNIALLVALHPELTARIARLVVIGGTAGRGNITPVAEFNVWADPEAAQRVLAASDLDVLLVGLDVTRRAVVDEADLHVLRDASPRGAMLADMVLGYAHHPPTGWPLHDALAIASIAEPALLSARAAAVAVDTGFGVSRVQTVYAFDPLPGEPTPATQRPDRRVQVALEVDVPRYPRAPARAPHHALTVPRNDRGPRHTAGPPARRCDGAQSVRRCPRRSSSPRGTRAARGRRTRAHCPTACTRRTARRAAGGRR